MTIVKDIIIETTINSYQAQYYGYKEFLLQTTFFPYYIIPISGTAVTVNNTIMDITTTKIRANSGIYFILEDTK